MRLTDAELDIVRANARDLVELVQKIRMPKTHYKNTMRTRILTWCKENPEYITRKKVAVAMNITTIRAGQELGFLARDGLLEVVDRVKTGKRGRGGKESVYGYVDRG